jgi:hypothetical protein
LADIGPISLVICILIGPTVTAVIGPTVFLRKYHIDPIANACRGAIEPAGLAVGSLIGPIGLKVLSARYRADSIGYRPDIGPGQVPDALESRWQWGGLLYFVSW